MQPLSTYLKELSAENGDGLSVAYTGTGALKAQATKTGKRTLKGIVGDSLLSAQRVYHSTFAGMHFFPLFFFVAFF